MVLLHDLPMPVGDALVYGKGHPQEGQITRPWVDWLTNLSDIQGKTTTRIASAFLDDQSGDISEQVNTGALGAGLYLLRYYIRLTVVDSLGASVDITFSFIWDNVSRSYSQTHLTSNNLAETGSNTVLIRVDGNTAIDVSTQTSFGSGDARYALDVTLDEVAA